MIKRRLTLLVIFLLFLAANMPIAASATEQSLQLYSETAILIDGDTGQILFALNMHQQMHPASITKIMTALVALEHGNMDDIITMSYDAVFSIGRRASHIALVPGEQLTLANAMYANAITSANDASNGIAEHIGGTIENFAAMMNQRAIEAGALNTNFTNAHGLHHAQHLTTAYDMARIMMQAIRFPTFTEMFGAQRHDIPPTNQQAQTRHLWTTNTMVSGRYAYDGFLAGKTGFTTPSGHTLVTAARRDGRTLIAVVMQSASRRGSRVDTEMLLDHGFEAFAQVKFTPEELSRENFLAGDITTDLVAGNGISLLIPNEYSKDDIDVIHVYENGMTRVIFSLNESVLGKLEMQADFNLSASDELAEPENGNFAWWMWPLGILGALLLGWGGPELVSLVVMRRLRRNKPTAHARS